MKRLFLIVSLLFFMASCNSAPEPKFEQMVQTFLTAYFQLDYDQVLPMCGSLLKADLEQSAQAIRNLPSWAQEKLHNDLLVYSFAIESVNVNTAKDSVFVHYLVFTPEAPAPEGTKSHLTLAKEENEWKVVKLL